MSDEVRIGSLRLKFLIDDAENGGKLTMFDMTVPEQGTGGALSSRFRRSLVWSRRDADSHARRGGASIEIGRRLVRTTRRRAPLRQP